MNKQAFLICTVVWLGALSGEFATGHDGEHPHQHDKPALLTTRAGARVLPPTKEDDVFHFVVYGDRTGGVPAGLKVLEQAVVDTNLLDPDLVLTVGDLVQGYNEKPEWMDQMTEFKAIMDRLQMKWFPVAGNHDVYWRGKGPAPAGQHESNYEEHFGPLWYSFAHKNAGFIVLYSDEGDAKSNEKGFNEGRLQQMSDAQLAFVDKALEELKGADHVFVFLHHPRWIGGGYTGSNWNVVHKKFVAAGNVSAVFAGHIHHMRYDAPSKAPGDHIEYFTLATTGGHLEGDIPDAGYLHHLNMVTVRKDRVTVAAIPVGAVIDPKDFTKEFLQIVEQGRTIRPVSDSPGAKLQVDGSAAGEFAFRITNPCPREVAVTAVCEGNVGNGRWLSSLDHEHFTIPPGASREVTFSVFRPAGNPTSTVLPGLRLQLELVGDSARIRLPDVVTPIPVRPAAVPANYFVDSQPHCLLISDPASAVRIAANQIRLPDGPMTLECWVRPTELSGYNSIIAKTQGSEYALFSDEGVPQFDINLDGRYVTAAATEKLSTTKWTHLAGVYDGKNVTIFVDGKKVDTKPGAGRRRVNDLPLYIGADPDGSGLPTRPMLCMIDEVRLAKSAMYDADFTPQRRHQPNDETVLLLHFDKHLGPFVLDQSAAAVEAILGATSQLVPVP